LLASPCKTGGLSSLRECGIVIQPTAHKKEIQLDSLTQISYVKKIFRSIQTRFPFLQDKVYLLRFYFMKLRKRPHEEDFNAISLFPSFSEHTFVDIGSNRGQAITSMLMMSTPDIKIIGFEPNPLIYTKLKNHFKKNKRVYVHNLGLSNENNAFNLFVPFYRKWMFDGLSSFEYKSARNWLKSRLWRYNDEKLSIKEIKCETKKLDEFQLSPYFIKIDVEGHELAVIQGAIETIKTHTPIILIEAINEETKKILTEFGYQFYTYLNGKFHEGTGELNTFCMNKEKYAELTFQNHTSKQQVTPPTHAHI